MMLLPNLPWLITEFLIIVAELIGCFVVMLITVSLLNIWVIKREGYSISMPFLPPAIGALISGFIIQRFTVWPLSGKQAIFAFLDLVSSSLGVGLASVTAGWIFQRKWVIERLSRPPPED